MQIDATLIDDAFSDISDIGNNIFKFAQKNLSGSQQEKIINFVYEIDMVMTEFYNKLGYERSD